MLSKKTNFLPRSIQHEPIIKIDEFESIRKGYKPTKVASAFNNSHIEYKSSEKLSINQFFKKMRPYLGNMIDELKKSDEWIIHLTMKAIFTSSKDIDDNRIIYSKSDNIEIMIRK